MASLLQDSLDNLVEGFLKVIVSLLFIGLMIFNRLECNKIYKKIAKDLAKRTENIYEFLDVDIKNFCLMLRKDVSLYEYMDI